MDRFDTQLHRRFRRGDAHRPALEQDLAFIRPMHARKNLDERRLARAVVAEQAHDFAAFELQAHAFEGMHAGVPLVQVAYGHQRGRCAQRVGGGIVVSVGTQGSIVRCRGQCVHSCTFRCRAVRRIHALATTAKMVRLPTANLNQLASTCVSTRPLSITRISRAPTTAPSTLPIPPDSAVPPITAAATACSSRPSPIEGSAAPSRSTWIKPAKPASTEHSTKENSFTRRAGTPLDMDASRNPPVAFIQLPRLVADSRNAAAAPMAINQRNDARNNPSGPIKLTNNCAGIRSIGRFGGKPPDSTTVSDRTMNNMPSVVMKLGMLKTSVINPFASPTHAATTSPIKNAGQNGTPAFMSSVIAIGVSAKTEPTDKSNSPQIISSVTPIATSPTSGNTPSTPRIFSALRNIICERTWNKPISTASNTMPASSGFCR